MRKCILLVAVLAGCGPFWDGIGDSSDEIADAVAAGKPFRLADVTDFEWDRFYVVPPYSSQNHVDELLGFHWGEAGNSDFAMQDGGSLLVFVRDGDVVEAFDQDWADGYFDCLYDTALTPREASLRVERVRQGRETLSYVRRAEALPAEACASVLR